MKTVRAPEDAIAVTNPFPGLRPFQEDEEHLFFGRESQVDTMVDKLAETNFLAVIGASGSGKSSLVNCGLNPALHSGFMAEAGTSWRIAKFRPGGNPLRSMARALAREKLVFNNNPKSGMADEAIVETSLRMSKLGLVDVYKQANLDEGTNLLVIVDQFEELFRFQNIDQATDAAATELEDDILAFVNLILEPSKRNQHPIFVAITMRSDFLGDCTKFPGLAEAINQGQYLVPRMTRHELRAAITGPVHVGGSDIEPTLLTRLVNDVGDSPDQLSILQHALNRTWARWESETGATGPLTLAHYEAIGTMSRALDQHAEKAFDELGPDQHRNICEKIFKALTDMATDARGTRRPTKLSLLCKLAEAEQEDVTAVLHAFRKPSRSFIMPPAGEDLLPDSVIDISHESLMRVWERLGKWAREEAQSAQMYRRLAETALLHGEGRANLWRDPDLQLALNWRDQQQPLAEWAHRYHRGYEEMLGFLNQSVEARDSEEQQKRQEEQRKDRLRKGLAVTTAVSLVLFGYLYMLWSSNQTLELESLLANAEAKSISAVEEARRGDPVHGMLTVLSFLEANKHRPDPRWVPSLERALWEAYSRTHVDRVIDAHDSEVRAVTFSPDGTLMASGDFAGVIHVHNTLTWERVSSIQVDLDDTVYRPGRVLGLTFSPDGSMLASGTSSFMAEPERRHLGRVRLWDPANGQLIRELGANPDDPIAHGRGTRNLKFDDAGRQLVTTSYDNTARVWNVRTGQLEVTLEGHSTDYGKVDVYDADFNPQNPDVLATAGNDGRVMVWNITPSVFTPSGAPPVFDTADALTVIDAHDGRAASVDFSPDGSVLLSASDDDTVRMWNWQTGERISKPLAAHTANIWRAVFDSFGERFFTASWDRTVAVWDFETLAQLARLRGHTKPVRDVAFDPESERLASASQDETVRIWSLEPQDVVWRLRVHDDLRVVLTSPSDPNQLVGGGDEGILYVWDLAERQLIDAFQDEQQECSFFNWQPSCRIVGIAYARDGNKVAALHSDRTVRIWDLDTREMVGPLGPFQGRPTLIGIDEQAFAVVDDENRTSRLSFFAFEDGQSVVFDQFAEADLRFDDRVRSLAFEPASATIATGLEDGTLYTLDMKDGARAGPFEISPGSRIDALTFSDSGETLYAASFDWRIRSWNMAAQRLDDVMMDGHRGGVYRMVPIADGRRLATSSDDETIRIWSTADGREIANLPGHSGSVRALALLRQNGTLLSASADETMLVREVFPDIWALRDRVCDALSEIELSAGAYLDPAGGPSSHCPEQPER